MKSGRKKKNKDLEQVENPLDLIKDDDLEEVENPLDLIDDDDIPLLAKSLAELIKAKGNNLLSSPTQSLNEEKGSEKQEESKTQLGPDLFKQSLESILNREVSDEEAEELDDFLSGGLSDEDEDEEVFPGPK